MGRFLIISTAVIKTGSRIAIKEVCRTVVCLYGYTEVQRQCVQKVDLVNEIALEFYNISLAFLTIATKILSKSQGW